VGVSNGGGGGGGGGGGVVNVKEGRGKRERGKEIERLKNYKNTKIHARMKYLLLLFLLCAPCVHPVCTLEAQEDVLCSLHSRNRKGQVFRLPPKSFILRGSTLRDVIASQNNFTSGISPAVGRYK
jgi:hypothetical protein